jgi:hypothetical protein
MRARIKAMDSSHHDAAAQRPSSTGALRRLPRALLGLPLQEGAERIAIGLLAACLAGCQGGPTAPAQDASQDAPSDTVAPEAGDGDGSDADGSDAGTSPSTIFGPGLSLWLDADESSTVLLDADAGSRVMEWEDRSSWHNRADAAYLENGGMGHIDRILGVANGHSAMRFSGTDTNSGAFQVWLNVKNHSSSLGFARDFLIAIVAAYENILSPINSGQAVLFKSVSDDGPAYFPGPWFIANSVGGSAGLNSVVYAGNRAFWAPINGGVWSSTNGWNDGQFHVFAMRYDATSGTMSVRTDGIETQSKPGVPLSSSGSYPIYPAIGGVLHYDTNPKYIENPLKGYIAEVIVAEYTFGSPTEVAQLNNYLQNRYNLAF